MRVNNPDRSPLGINGCDKTQLHPSSAPRLFSPVFFLGALFRDCISILLTRNERDAPTALLLKKKTVVTVMESKENAAEGNVGDKQVKEIVEPTIAVPSEATVNVAIDEMAAQKADSAPVIDEGSKLLGIVSRDGLNRKVGGLGHDPKSFPVEPEINKNNAFCFSDQKIAEAEELMRNEKVREVPVVDRDQVLIGKANLEKIKKEKKEKPKIES